MRSGAGGSHALRPKSAMLLFFFLATASLAAEITFFRDSNCRTSVGGNEPGLKLTAFTNAFAPLPTEGDPSPLQSGLSSRTTSVTASACSSSSITFSGRRADCSPSDSFCNPVLTVPIGSCISHESALKQSSSCSGSGGYSNSVWLKVTDATCANPTPVPCTPNARFIALLRDVPLAAVNGGSRTPSALAFLSLTFSAVVQGVCATCTASIDLVTDMASDAELIVAFSVTAPPGSALPTGLSAAVTASAFSSALVSRLVAAGFPSASVGYVTPMIPDAADVPRGPRASPTPPWGLLGLLALLLEPLGCCFCRGPAGNSEGWRRRAARASPLLAAGFALLTLGLMLGAAAPVIPWYTSSEPPITITLLRQTYTFSGTVYTTQLPWYFAIGGALVYVGLVFLLVAWGMALAVLMRVRAFARGGAAPSADACAASLPAVVGCAWAGLVVALGGAGWAWAWFWGGFYFSLPSGSSSPGSSLLAVAVASLFTAAVFLAAASRTLVGLPGVGAARDCCCCVETRPLAVGARAPRRSAPRTGRRQSRRKSKATAPVGLP